MAQTSILGVAVEYEIAVSMAARVALTGIQRRRIPIVVYGKPGARMDKAEQQGLVFRRLHQEPSASMSFLQTLLGWASQDGPAVGGAQLLVIDTSEVRLGVYASLGCSPVVRFNPTTEQSADLLGRLADYGLVPNRQDPPPRAAR